MKKFTRQISSIFAILVLGSCSSEMYQATWQTKKVVADGNPTEWSLPLRYSDPKSGLQYNITNDETNLYICIRATEQPAQMKILSSGMIIWLDPSGKNKETVGIKFPLPGMHNKKPSGEDVQPDIIQGKKHDRMNLEEQFQLQKPEITLTGFKPEYNGTFHPSDAKGIKAAIDWDEKNNMTYELVIPLKSFYSKDIKALRDNPVVGFKINIAAITRPQGSGSHGGGMQGGEGGGQHHGRMGGGQGGMGGGHGGGHSGNMGGSHQSAGSSAYSSMNESTSIKFKIQLNGLVKK